MRPSRLVLASACAATAALAPAPGAAATSSARAAAAAPCPASDVVAVRSARPAAAAALVPAGAVAVTLCRYGGLSEIGPPAEPHALVRHRTVTAAPTVTALAHELNALPLPTPDPISCGEDEGTAITASFAYRSGPADPVAVSLTGCETATNGRRSVVALNSPVVGRLEALVPLPPRIPMGPGPVLTRDADLAVQVSCRSGCSPDERVAVLDGASAVAVARVQPGRHARFSLYPGTYSLRLLTGGHGDRGTTLARASITLAASRATRTTLSAATRRGSPDP